jgi:hypothetical protein
MTTERRLVRVYRRLLVLYPRRFRDEYGADMVQLVRDACRDEPTWRVWRRIALDIAISIPSQHLEARMRRAPSQLVPLAYAAIAAAGLVLALVGGSSPAPLTIGLGIAVVAGAVAVVAWRRAGPIRRTLDTGSLDTGHWWKVVLAGPLLVGSVIVGSGLGVNAWFLGLFVVILGLLTTGAGVLLGLVHLTRRRLPMLPR